MRVRSLAAVAMVALALAGCGGDDGEGAEQPPGTSAESGAAAASGETIFIENCGGCHTLPAAGTNGTVGPNLAEHMHDMARVEQQVRNGGGGMPAFEGRLSDEEITAVAEYVSSNAGG